ncbi:MAG: hypothetical protein IPK19_19795 [Chloroflexi bacterium]|nr:hypothetical protein [Chloroflexota bacterium]
MRNEIPVYLSILPDEAALAALQDVMGDSTVPLETSSEPEFNEEAWNAFERIVQLYSATQRLVVIRPPVSAETYENEAAIFADVIARTEALLERHDVPLIDMNPNPYESMDGSHLVWFDSVPATEQLAQQIIGAWQPR